ncbi:hypothetical protein CLV28_0802 [Sediminihabitans luteus]|uniref:Uncharacterized protein n=1 Tax=Sediminihabitans luteus TaxID=1138585 RepID=A0A2M9D071_9CELL|nr:hypothetical protein [Sediminihabitans luteus]PJJ77581.1 hypothetical protein CLV28_0802 [Sediminihabitans luteus]GII98481.1 hypothetical protein Slu03_08590 [Sediminihabitans luteus]
MRAVYRVLAWAIPVLVLVQAAAIAFALFGLGKWVEDGNDLTSSTFDSDSPDVGGIAGFAVHGMNGMMLIPLVALLLLVVSFFAKVPRGTFWALLVVVDVVLQIGIAFAAFGAPVVGAFHGINAFVLAGLGVAAARAARPGRTTATVPERATT